MSVRVFWALILDSFLDKVRVAQVACRGSRMERHYEIDAGAALVEGEGCLELLVNECSMIKKPDYPSVQPATDFNVDLCEVNFWKVNLAPPGAPESDLSEINV